MDKYAKEIIERLQRCDLQYFDRSGNYKNFVTHLVATAKQVPVEPKPLLKLWYVPYLSEDGSDFTAFIRATCAASAADFFRQSLPARERQMMADQPIWVREVPPHDEGGRYGVIYWDDMRIIRVHPTEEERE